jgi:ABC-type nitrate/sulfonate/bicarbonate transport system permease component
LKKISCIGPGNECIGKPIAPLDRRVARDEQQSRSPIQNSTAAGLRQIRPVLTRVGRSFRSSPWQIATNILILATRHSIMTGIRLGFCVAVIGILLAETKLSNRGVGFEIINAYAALDIPRSTLF